MAILWSMMQPINADTPINDELQTETGAEPVKDLDTSIQKLNEQYTIVITHGEKHED